MREKCLAHEAPRSSTALQVGNTLGSDFTMGIVGNVNANRMYADCDMILGDEELKGSCPAYVVACEQYFAERRYAAGASKVIIHNERAASPPPTITNCTQLGSGLNCVSH